MKTMRYLEDADTLVNEVCVPTDHGKTMRRTFRRAGTVFVHDDGGELLDDWGPVGESPQQRVAPVVSAPRLTTV